MTRKLKLLAAGDKRPPHLGPLLKTGPYLKGLLPRHRSPRLGNQREEAHGQKRGAI